MNSYKKILSELVKWSEGDHNSTHRTDMDCAFCRAKEFLEIMEDDDPEVLLPRCCHSKNGSEGEVSKPLI